MYYLMVCCKCSHPWLDKVGAFGDNFSKGCPACGSIYWVWQVSREQLNLIAEDGNHSS